MSRKLAVKRLKPTDLSFFQAYLQQNPRSKQKSFNLDGRVIEGRFFPSLGEIAEARARKQIPVQLTFYGPDGAGAHILMRKILKQEKNWRLNGEVVHDPEGQAGRYLRVAPDDLALMEFTGTGEPEAVKVVLVSALLPADAALHAAIVAKFPTGSIWVPDPGDLEKLVDAANPSPNHPVRDWLDDALIEDVGFGGGGSAQQIARRRSGRGLSHDELREAKASAEATGRRGEELLDRYLGSMAWPGVVGHRWVANENAVAPYDFELDMSSGGHRLVDAKSTSGGFDNPLHMSLGEMDQAVRGGVPYDIARLYEVRDGSGRLRIARDIAAKLRPLLASLSSLPSEVAIDSLSFEPGYFDFEGEEHVVAIPDDAP